MHVIFSDNFLLPNYYYYYKSSSDFKIIETNCKKPVNGQMSLLNFDGIKKVFFHQIFLYLQTEKIKKFLMLS